MATGNGVIGTGRLEAFSDGVIAIIITIMVLELKAPHAPTWAALGALWPTGLAYVVSFVYVGIYWNNHHHLMHATPAVTAGILWSNLHLLFWLSLIPFVTDWSGQTHFAAIPTAAYGVVLEMSGLAYFVLELAILSDVGRDSPLGGAIGRDRKGKASLALYAVGVALSFVNVWAANAVYVGVAGLWLVPDRQMERAIGRGEGEAKA